MQVIPLSLLTPDPANARATPRAEEITPLAASMQTLGLLHPILVRPAPQGEGFLPETWLIVAGQRRYLAAKQLGWVDIAAELYTGEAPVLAASAAENMVRRAMHPVDQWRAVEKLCAEFGYTVEVAAQALGIEVVLAKKMAWLGQMDPAVIRVMRESPDIPSNAQLRLIALAPPEVQRAAIAHYKGGAWVAVANACTIARIPRSRALFDPATSHPPLAWEEDLFAAPDDPDRFTTTDIGRFLTLQTAAVQERVAKSKGRLVWVDLEDNDTLRTSLPKGWHGTWETVPKRWAKDDPRKLFVTVEARPGYDLGKLHEVVGVSTARPKPAADAAPAPARPDINKATQARLAVMKAEAVRAQLNLYQAHGPAAMLHALLLACAFDNYGVAGGNRLAAALIDETGQPRDVDGATLCDLAAQIIGHGIVFPAPDAYRSSGRAAEWLATLIDAQMPRCDTEEILRGVSVERLSTLATAHGLPAHGTGPMLRKRLIGKLADWTPVTFGAPGPVAWATAPDDDDVAAIDAAEGEPNEEIEDAEAEA